MADLAEQRREQMFPKLSAAQVGRLAALGRRTGTRAGEAGEILTRNAYPHTSLDVDGDECARELLERYGVVAGATLQVLRQRRASAGMGTARTRAG